MVKKASVSQLTSMPSPVGDVTLHPSTPLETTATVDPSKHAIVFNSKLSKSARFLGCTPGSYLTTDPLNLLSAILGGPICNILCWDKLSARGYVRVYENRVESNYPFTTCCGLSINDNVRVTYFDKFPSSFKHESMCTPHHFCMCIACSGEVMATAPCDAVNNCCCPCCRQYYGGLADADAFVKAISSSKTVFKDGNRMMAGAFMLNHQIANCIQIQPKQQVMQ